MRVLPGSAQRLSLPALLLLCLLSGCSDDSKETPEVPVDRELSQPLPIDSSPNSVPKPPPIPGVILYGLGCQPSELAVGVVTDVIFSCIVASESGWLPPSLTLFEVDERGAELAEVASMFDDGREPDVVSGDAVYTARVASLSLSASSDAHSLRHRSTVVRDGAVVHSPIHILKTSRAPTGLATSNQKQIVTDRGSGASMVANELLLALKSGVSEARITEILRSVDGQVIGTIPGGTLQVRIGGEGTSATVLRAVHQLQGYPETDYAEPNFIDEVGDTPGDVPGG